MATDISRPPTPPTRPDTPPSTGYFSVPFERFVKDEISDWASGFTLLGISPHVPPNSAGKLTRLSYRHNGNLFRFTSGSPPEAVIETQ